MLIDTSEDVTLPVQFTNPSTGAPQSPDALPVFRVIGADGPASGANGTGAYLDAKSISGIDTGVTTGIASAAHGLITGMAVEITGAAGTTGVNGIHPITVLDANTFTFNDVTTSGSYTSGASWRAPGLFGLTLDSGIRSAMAVGRTYLILAYGNFSGSIRTEPLYATVV